MKTHRVAIIVIGLVVLCGVVAVILLYTQRETTPPPAPAKAPTEEARSEVAPVAERAEWTTYHGDNALTGVAAGALPEKLDVRWRFKAGAPVRETPVVHERHIFFASARGEVIAIDFDAQRLWSRELFTGEQQNGEPVRERIEAPLACLGEMILVGTSRGVLYALDAANGDEKWRAQIDGPILGAPNGMGDRVYVIGRAKGVLHCLDAKSGQILWRSEDIERCDGSPSVSNAGVVFGSCAAALHVFAPDTGKLLYNIEIDQDSQVAGGVALDGDCAISGTRSGKVLQADVKAGKIQWTNKDSEAETFATPAVTSEWVVTCANDGIVMGLERATGKLRWRFDTKGSPTSPVIAGDKVVVAADGELLLLRLSDGTRLWSLKVSDEITSPAVVAGLVLVGSEDGTVVAFGFVPEPEGGAHP